MPKTLSQKLESMLADHDGLMDRALDADSFTEYVKASEKTYAELRELAQKLASAVDEYMAWMDEVPKTKER